jgi:hypothetical protein
VAVRKISMHVLGGMCHGTRPIMASLLKDAPSQYSMRARSRERSSAQTTFALSYKLSFRLP